MRTRAPYLPDRRGNVPTRPRPPATVDRVETAELRPTLPANLPVKLQALLYVHLTVTSRRWQSRRASRDGTVHHLAGGPVMRVRTELLTPVPPLERTPRQ